MSYQDQEPLRCAYLNERDLILLRVLDSNVLSTWVDKVHAIIDQHVDGALDLRISI